MAKITKSTEIGTPEADVAAALMLLKKHDAPIVPTARDSVAKVITSDELLPVGITRENFVFMVSAAWERFTTLERMPTFFELKLEHQGHRMWPGETAAKKVYFSNTFSSACYWRGIRGETSGLDDRMMLLVAKLCDTSTTAQLSTRLAQCQVSWAEYQTWLNYPPFRNKLDELAKKAVTAAEANIAMALTSAASNGNLEAIKYHDVRTGRAASFNPGPRMEMPVIFAQLVDIIKRNVKDPIVLRQIGSEVAALAKRAGVE